jgi:hypothetical protein
LIANSFAAESSAHTDALKATASIKSLTVSVNEFVNVWIVGWLDADKWAASIFSKVPDDMLF